MIARLAAIVSLSLLLALPLAAATADLGIYSAGYQPGFVVDPGAQFTVTVTVTFKGSDPAEHARLTLSLPEGTALTRVDSQFGTCVQRGNDIVCEASAPYSAAFSNTTFHLNAPTDFAGGIGTLSARVSSDTPDPNPANDVWTATFVARRFLMVESDADDGPKSLRQTINTLNATCGGDLPCKIIFSRDMLIEPLTPLPAITACNSSMDAGGAADAPLRIELRGTHQRNGSGLEIRTDCLSPSYAEPGVTIRRLAIGGFPDNGIGVITTSRRPFGAPLGVEHIIQECFIGTDNSGTIARPNGLRGIATAAPDARVTIYLNTISGNARSGIAFWSVGSASVFKNRIGIGTDNRALPNGASGIFVASGDVGASDNEIAYNLGPGISTLYGTMVNGGNIIRENGALPIDIGLNGPSRAGALRPPQLVDAFYDPSTGFTTIRGHLSGNNDGSPQGGTFVIRFAASDHLNSHGFADAARPLSAAGTSVYPGRAGDFDRDFEVLYKGDLRGQLIVGFTSYAAWPDLLTIASSEFSDGIVVH